MKRETFSRMLLFTSFFLWVEQILCSDFSKDQKRCETFKQATNILNGVVLRFNLTKKKEFHEYAVLVTRSLKGTFKKGETVALLQKVIPECSELKFSVADEVLFALNQNNISEHCSTAIEWRGLDDKQKRVIKDASEGICHEKGKHVDRRDVLKSSNETDHKNKGRKEKNKEVIAEEEFEILEEENTTSNGSTVEIGGLKKKTIKKLKVKTKNFTHSELLNKSRTAEKIAEKLDRIQGSDVKANGTSIEIVTLKQLSSFGSQAPEKSEKFCLSQTSCEQCITNKCIWDPTGLGLCQKTCDDGNSCWNATSQCSLKAPTYSDKLKAEVPLSPPSNTSIESTSKQNIQKCLERTKEGCLKCIVDGLCTWQINAAACSYNCSIKPENGTNCIDSKNVRFCPAPIAAQPPPEKLSPERQCKVYQTCETCINSNNTVLCTWQEKLCTFDCSLQISNAACIGVKYKNQTCPVVKTKETSLKPSNSSTKIY